MDYSHKIDILMPVGEKGGVENVVGKTAEYLQGRGYRVRIVQMVWGQARWVPETVEFYPLMEGKGHYSLNRFVEKYTEFIQSQGMPDLVLAVAWPLMVLVAKLAFLACPHAHGKIISWLHGPVEQYVRSGYGGMESVEKADGAFVLNKRTEAMLKRNPGCHGIHIVRNPVDFSRCQMVKKRMEEELRLVFVGRISKEKRLGVIIRALQKTKAPWKLKVIGEGPQKKEAEELAESLSLAERVEFCGWQENPWENVDGVAATVLASMYECFPLSAVESLACGIPVIAPPVDGITELIEPGRNGFIYPQGDVGRLVDILDAMAEGEDAAFSPVQCRQSVLLYEESQALSDFGEKVADVFDKISVIIPCYNVQDRIAGCLDSVFGQQLQGVDLEVICIDDKSEDGTVCILRQYEEKYSENMVLVLLEENRGPGNARNIGMQYASGNYINFVDADDLTDPRMLQALYQKILDAQCDVAECAYRQMPWGSPPIATEKGEVEYFDMAQIAQKKAYIMKHGWKTGPCGRLYRRDFLMEHQIYFLPDTNMEDIYFSELCMFYMKSYIRIPETYYFYCYNPAGIMHSERMLQYYMDTAAVQIRTAERLMQEGRLSGFEDEYAYLHFSKAFAEPVDRMREDGRYFSYENFVFLKQSLFRLFPNIMDTPYFLRDKSRRMELYRMLLAKDWTEHDVKEILQESKK